VIYLNPENPSSLGDDTFWTWLRRELPDRTAFGVPDEIEPGDVVLQYSTLGKPKHPAQTVALCWELYPEMKVVLDSSEWDAIIERTHEAAANSARRVVATRFMAPEYERHGPVDVLPIGVDTDLFRPMDRETVRRKYGIPLDRRVGFWSGTMHQMKGFEYLRDYAALNPDIDWIIVWKHDRDGHMDGARNFCQVAQATLAELMNCADFLACPGWMRPFFMVEWEAMACGLPPVFVGTSEKDFVPSADPRADIFQLGWDRHSAKRRWLEYLGCDA
jgi:glycosyltransferase involved in cell wall biosynthesis